MGLHSPFGYVGYEERFLKAFIFLLDNFCTCCHTNDDFHNGCTDCPVGNLVYKSKEYLLEAYEPETKDGIEKKLIRKIKRIIKSLEPHEGFNGDWIFQDERSADVLLELRELRKDLDFASDRRIDLFKIKQRRRKQVDKYLDSIKKKRKIK